MPRRCLPALWSVRWSALWSTLLILPTLAGAQAHDPSQHHKQAIAVPADARQLVNFPEPMRSHTLANMRDHLAALGEIQAALAGADYDKAADLAEKRLGMSSLTSHGAHEVARFMPKAMQEAGTAMHRSASRFATVATDASLTGDLKSAIGALAQVNQTCVACHAGFRLK